MLHYLILCLLVEEIPYLYELTEALLKEGVVTVSLNPSALSQAPETIPAESFLITDSPAGASFARMRGLGYAAYVSGSGSSFSGFQDAACVIQGFDEVTPDFIQKLYQRSRGIPWTILTTDRTLVREFAPGDLDSLYDLYEDAEIRRFLPPLRENREEELQFQLSYIRNMYEFFGFGFWLVFDRTTGELIGRAGLNCRENLRDLELGYLFRESARGKGLAEEVCRAIIAYSKEILGQERLSCCIHPENSPSVRLALRLGFRQEGKITLPEGELLLFTLEIG